MRWIINYIRSLFCKHKWEFIKEIAVFDSNISKDRPLESRCVYRCRKCGYIQRTRL